LLQIKNQILQESVLRGLTQILDKSIEQKIIQTSLEKITSLLDNNNLNYYVNAVLTKIVIIVPNLGKEILDFISKLTNQSDGSYLVASSLPAVVLAMPAEEAFKELVELLKSSNYSVQSAAARSLPEVLKAMPAAEAYKELVELLKSPNYNVQFVAAISLPAVVKAMPVEAAFKELVALLKSSNDDVKYAAARSLPAVVKAKSSLAEAAFKELVALLKSSNDDVKYAAASSLPAVVEAMPNLAEQAFKEITELLKSSNDDAKRAAASSLPAVVKADSSLAKEAFKELVGLLKSSNYDIWFAVARSLPTVVKADSSLAKEAFKELVELLKSSDGDVRSAAANSLPAIVKAMPAEEAYKELVALLKSSNDDVKYAVASSLPAIVKAMPSLAEQVFKELVELLKSSNDDAKHAAARSLPAVVKAISFNNISYKQVNELLKIIDLIKTQEFDNDLHIAIKTTLKKITDYIGQEYEKNKDSEIIEWFNKCFNELPKISETRIFLKEICKSILKGGAINELENNFILKCIQKYGFTFTVSINKEQRIDTDKIIEGTIIFEDKSYEIFKNDVGQNHNGIVSLEEFAKLLLEQTNDPLAEQYTDNKPLFLNTGSALKIAACDLKSSSIINNVELHSDKWQLSLMHLSNHKKEIPSKVFILLERKSEFGEHVIYKIFMEESKLQTINYSLYPQNIDTEIRKQIFGEMEYIDNKPRYYGSIFEINLEAGEQLKHILESHKIVDSVEYHILRNLLKQTNIIDSEQLDYTWEEYIKHSNIKEFKKAELLKIESSLVRRDSWIIDIEFLKQSIKDLAAKATAQDSKIIKSLTEQVAHLSERQDCSQDRIFEIMDDIENLETSLNSQQVKLTGVTIEHTL